MNANKYSSAIFNQDLSVYHVNHYLTFCVVLIKNIKRHLLDKVGFQMKIIVFAAHFNIVIQFVTLLTLQYQ